MNPKNKKIWGLKAKTYATVIILVELMIIVSIVGTYAKARVAEAHALGISEMNTVISDRSAELTTSSPQAKEINTYMKTIFGENYNMAHAVQQVECSDRNPAYPKCINRNLPIEYSCGIFQINIKAHWNKIPVGKTYQEKCDYLNNPYNNILVAYKIFSDQGFQPWSGYTSGRYLKNL